MSSSLPVTSPARSPNDSGGREVDLPTRRDRIARVLPLLFIGLFGTLLASFPSQNLDLWQHLTNGRDLLRGTGTVSPTWLYDLATYGVFSAGGGLLLAAVKALLCGAVAVLLLRLGRTTPDWHVPLAVIGLAVLAMGSRLLLQPATLSLLFLAVTVWLLVRQELRGVESPGIWPGWRFVVLFVIWANVDGRFVLGLGVVALAWLGRVLDARPPDGRGRALARHTAWFGVLVLASCLSPSHIHGLRIPPELRAAVESFRTGGAAETGVVDSPFDRDYLRLFRDRPAWLAYYPLLGLSLLSWLVNWKRSRWAWLLPWLGLAIVSAMQARLIPFFAVLAGPVTAWNLQAFFADRGSPVRGRVRYAVVAFPVLLAVTFLVAAWPGWLQGPPFQPRRLAVEIPAAHQEAGAFLRRAHAADLWAEEARTLHVSADTAGAVAWYAPEDRWLRDDGVVEQLLAPGDPEPARVRLRALRVRRVVADGGERGGNSRAVLLRLLADPYEWPVLQVSGGVVVFGWRDPRDAGAADPYRGWVVDFSRLAFRPDGSEVAPPTRPREERLWWTAFWKPAPASRPLGREEATVLLRKAESFVPGAHFRHLAGWEAGQAAALVGSAAGWVGAEGLFDAGFRLTLFQPPLTDPLPPVTQVVLAYQRQYAFDRGDAPAGLLYAAVRAARRAVAENPRDANSYLVLGQAYVALLTRSEERGWAARLPQLRRIRQMQASAAFNRAVTLNPNLAAAHLELAQLYRTLDCLDLAVHHLRTYRSLPACFEGAGGLPPGDPRAAALDGELEHASKTLEFQAREFAKESARTSVNERAQMAVRRGLVAEARDLLLRSDVSAFGAQGADLQLSLLLHTGRPEEVERMDPEVRGSLGDVTYYWLRAQAHCALGEYDAADAELRDLAGPGDGLPPAELVGMEVAGLIGKTLLEEQPAGFSVARLVLGRLSRDNLQARVMEITANLQRPADVLVVRGLVALEAGDTGRAEEAFRTALRFSPSRLGGGQLDFNGERAAWECLQLIRENARRE